MTLHKNCKVEVAKSVSDHCYSLFITQVTEHFLTKADMRQRMRVVRREVLYPLFLWFSSHILVFIYFSLSSIGIWRFTSSLTTAMYIFCAVKLLDALSQARSSPGCSYACISAPCTARKTQVFLLGWTAKSRIIFETVRARQRMELPQRGLSFFDAANSIMKAFVTEVKGD